MVSIKATTVTVCDTDINGKFYPKKCVMNPNRVAWPGGRFRLRMGRGEKSLRIVKFHEVMHKLLSLFSKSAHLSCDL